jgi:hypothetical protein
MDRSSWATSNLVWGLSVFFFSFPFESCVGLMDGFSRILRSLGMRQWNLSNNAPFRVSMLLPLSPAPFWQDLCSSRHPSFPVPHTPPQTQSGLSCCLLSAMLSAFTISSLQPIPRSIASTTHLILPQFPCLEDSKNLEGSNSVSLEDRPWIGAVSMRN